MRLNSVEYSFVWPLFHFCISETNFICLIRKEFLINEGSGSRGCDADTGREIELTFMNPCIVI